MPEGLPQFCFLHLVFNFRFKTLTLKNKNLIFKIFYLPFPQRLTNIMYTVMSQVDLKPFSFDFSQKICYNTLCWLKSQRRVVYPRW